jgi:hypothetical protein
MRTKDIFTIVIVAIVLVVTIVLAPEKISTIFTAGDGTSLKELNEKTKTESSLKITLQANQTTKANLEQGMISASYYRFERNFFIGGATVGGVSTEFGVVTPALYFDAGYNFKNFGLEARAGKFNRSSIFTPMVDPQFSNFCIVAGEGYKANNAMQVSFVKGKTRIGFGHQGKNSFYKFDGGWYGYADLPISKAITLSGGADFGEEIVGHAAGKVQKGKNMFTATVNQIGSENENIIITYNRKDIPVFGNNVSVSTSTWFKGADHGFHLVAGLLKWGTTLFAEGGYENSQPYFGLGTSINF